MQLFPIKALLSSRTDRKTREKASSVVSTRTGCGQAQQGNRNKSDGGLGKFFQRMRWCLKVSKRYLDGKPVRGNFRSKNDICKSP